MLLFNNVTGIAVFVNTLFKYISCYYLTLSAPGKKDKKAIQIHLMLLFNGRKAARLIKDKNSNTSHVII